jgi:hypothetical protein
MMEEYDPLKVDEIILNLKLISKIKQNEKMIVINKVLKVDNRPLNSFWRWLQSINREDTINFIEFIINSGLENIQERNTEIIFNNESIKKELANTLSGLDNLGATYKLDNVSLAKIDIFKEKINRLCL